ncbi:MAG: sigma-70 family RNA polymerase sigma factor [Kiritimatiellaeota bacterium]|nr:sigma-70 family RNA polymerase sigma factor [Kiritimatiellota bacterium]
MTDSNIGAIKTKGRDKMSDSDVVSKFNEIYEATNKPVLAFITARCGKTADVGDIFQETYIELYRLINKRGTDYVTDAKALAFRIAKQKISRHYSFLKRLQMFVPMTDRNRNEDNEKIDADIEFSGTDADSFLTEDFVVNQIMLENAKQFVKNKPEDVKKIFYLFYDMDRTIPEIAEALALSESNVKNKLYRTIKELKDLLK